MPEAQLARRPQQLLGRATTVHGLRAVQARMAGQQVSLDVWLYPDPPPELAAPAAWKLIPAPGGRQVGIGTASITSGSPIGHVTLALTGVPDTARYRLEVASRRRCLRPAATWLPVHLRPDCPDLGACFEPASVPPPPSSPVHDYTARDWRSLRRALVEFLAREAPDADLSPADPTMTLLGALRPRRRPSALPPRPRRDRGVPRDGATPDVRSAPRAPRRLRVLRRGSRAHLRARVRAAERAGRGGLREGRRL